MSLDDKNRINNRLLDENLRRFLYFLLIMVPINLIHIVLFLVNLDPSNEVEHSWRVGIIITHAFWGISTILAALIAKNLRKKQIVSNNKSWYFIYLFTFIALISSVSLTAFDQIVTSAINPYILALTGIAITMLLKPLASVILYSIAYILLFWAMSYTQLDENVLFSNYLNALSVTVLSIILSVILWRKNISEASQALIIESQQIELDKYIVEITNKSEVLRELNSTKDKFFSILAHDLKSPLGSFRNVTALMHESPESFDDKERQEILSHLKNSSNNIFNLLENLLEWSLSQQGKVTFNLKEINLNSMVNSIISLNNTIAEEKLVKLINHIDDSYVVKGDFNMLNTIFRNLISNAIKFSYQNGKVEIGIVDNATDETKITCFVRDNGVGMSQETQNMIFNIDSNIKSIGTYGERGTGLGLILCKEFIEKHNGQIWVESQLGKGSTFYFELPKT